jgi:hypothetical protein
MNLLTLDMKTVRHVLYAGAMLAQTKSLWFVLDVYDKSHAHCAHTQTVEYFWANVFIVLRVWLGGHMS